MSNYSKIVACTIRWGSWGQKLSRAKMSDLINSCVELGVTTFDLADVYGNYTTEREFGDALIISGVEREKIQIITKCGIVKPCAERPGFTLSHYNTSKKYILDSVDQSLDNFNTSYVDMLMIHRPSMKMDYAEIADAFAELSESGKVKEFGVANFSPYQLEAMQKHFPLAAHQFEYSLTHVDNFRNGTYDCTISLGLTPMAWSPIGGAYIYGRTKSKRRRLQRLNEFVTSKNWTMFDASILFLLNQGSGITPVLGASELRKVKQAVDLLDYNLPNEDWFEMMKMVHNEIFP